MVVRRFESKDPSHDFEVHSIHPDDLWRVKGYIIHSVHQNSLYNGAIYL